MVCCSPLSLASFPLSTHQQAALGCEASCTWIAGMLAAAPAEDPVTKEHTTTSSNTSPVPHVFEDTTLQLLCAARRHHHHHHCGPLPTRLLASRTQPVLGITTMGRAAALLYSPLPPSLLLLSTHQRPRFFHLQGRGVCCHTAHHTWVEDRLCLLTSIHACV